MKQKSLALSAIALVFSTIAAMPTVAQAAIAHTDLANRCVIENEVRIRFGLPAVDCGQATQVRAKSANANEKQAANVQTVPTETCKNDEVRARFGLPTNNCGA